jgi:hypothetical protein
MGQPQIVITNTAPSSDQLLTSTEIAALYLKLDQTTSQEITGGVPSLESTRTINQIHQLVDVKYLEESLASIGINYYLTDEASGVGTYKLNNTTLPTTGGEKTVTLASTVSADHLIQGWVQPGAAGADGKKLAVGSYILYITAAKSGSKVASIYFEFWEISPAGADVTLLGTSNLSDVITTKRNVIIGLNLSEVKTIATGNYCGIKVYVRYTGTAASTTTTLYYGQTTNSHVASPTNKEILDEIYALKTELTKESIAGIKTADSPEFADVNLTPLELEATYSASTWAYLVALFTTVPKSIKEHLIKIWDRLFILEEAMGELLIDYTVPSDVASISITTDSLGNALDIPTGSRFIIYFTHQFASTADETNIDGRIAIRFNNITGSVYRYSTLLTTAISISTQNRYNNFSWGDFTISNYIFGVVSSLGENLAGSRYNQPPANGLLESAVSGVTRIDISSSDALTYLIKAGSNLKVYKL